MLIQISKYKLRGLFKTARGLCDSIPKEVVGVIRPKLKSSTLNPRQSPKNEMFYGLPFSKEMPKSKDDLLRKIDYLNSHDDMVDLFYGSSQQFDGHSLSHFIERLYFVKGKELRTNLNKAKSEKFLFKKESEIKKESEERIDLFLEDIESLISSKNFDFHELVLVYFEVIYRFRKDIPKVFSDSIFSESQKESHFETGKFNQKDLLKLGYILSRYKTLLNHKQDAQNGLALVTFHLHKFGFNNLTKEEIFELVNIISYDGVFPDLSLYTNLEPHLLKYSSSFTPSDLVSLFSCYLKNFMGSDFFIQSIGFSISSNLQFMSLKDIMRLLALSDRKFFNRPELEVKFSDIFLKVFTLLSERINEFNEKDISVLLKSMISTGYNDKRFLHLLSTVYLKYGEREEFRRLVYVMYYFSVCSLENSIFMKKSLELMSLNLLCIENRLEGNENFDNLLGIYDRNFIKLLIDRYDKNVEKFVDKIKYFEKIQFDETEIFYLCDTLIKMIWSLTYFLSGSEIAQSKTITELVNNSVKVFNRSVSNLVQNEENGIKFKIYKTNVDKLIQSYLFLMINSKKFSIKNNLNLEILNLRSFELQNDEDEISGYKEFLNFKLKVREYIKNNEINTHEIQYEKDYSDIGSYDVFKYLKADFFRLIKSQKEGDAQQTQIIFINDPYDFFEITMNYTGFNKLRKNICSSIKINYLEIDYAEFLIFNKDIKVSEDNNNYLVEEFIKLKLN